MQHLCWIGHRGPLHLQGSNPLLGSRDSPLLQLEGTEVVALVVGVAMGARPTVGALAMVVAMQWPMAVPTAMDVSNLLHAALSVARLHVVLLYLFQGGNRVRQMYAILRGWHFLCLIQQLGVLFLALLRVEDDLMDHAGEVTAAC